MLDILREEKKYVLPLFRLMYIKGQLEATLHGDAFNGTKPYMVRSLYFDSVYDVDYNEKDMGLNDRKKIRLRIYDTDATKAKLEYKAKSGSMQHKQSITIAREDAIEMTKGKYDVLLKYDEELAGFLYRKMTMEAYIPRCVVQYDRIAFATGENNTRITLDMNISSNEGNFDIFDKNLQLYPVMNMDKAILEVKYNRFLLGYVKRVLQSVDMVEMSASKYCMARKYGLGGECL